MNALTRFRRWRARRAVERIRIRLAHAGVCVCDLTDEQVVRAGHALVAERFRAAIVAEGHKLGYGDLWTILHLGEANYSDYLVAERGLL